MKQSLVLYYACLIKPSIRRNLPPRLKELAELMPHGISAIADIGTDHGLLAFALAKQRPHTKVIGVDASAPSLKQGAETLPRVSNLQFFHGDGLDALDTVGYDVQGACIAGMGVPTMVDILRPNKLVDLNCQNLVLQPTGSRPRHLSSLYEHLAFAKWHLATESMCYSSRRWYLTSLWQRSETVYDTVVIPGVHLDTSNDDQAREWVAHHCNWIQSNHNAGSEPTVSEKLWMERFCSG